MNLEQTYAQYVDKEGAKKIQDLERETGTLIMAYATPYVPAELSPEKLAKIQKLEKELCVRLVAYKGHA
jgi:hypothetical protein